MNFDREALDMDVRYISEPEKVDAERRAKEEAAEAKRKAIANGRLRKKKPVRNRGKETYRGREEPTYLAVSCSVCR